jgi:hypothetical protein
VNEEAGEGSPCHAARCEEVPRGRLTEQVRKQGMSWQERERERETNERGSGRRRGMMRVDACLICLTIHGHWVCRKCVMSSHPLRPAS